MGKKTKIGLAAAAVGAAAWAGSKALANPQQRPAKEVLNYERPMMKKSWFSMMNSSTGLRMGLAELQTCRLTS